MNALQFGFNSITSGNSLGWRPQSTCMFGHQMPQLAPNPASIWGGDGFSGSNFGLLQSLCTPMFGQGMLLGMELGLMMAMLQNQPQGCRGRALPKPRRHCCHPLKQLPKKPNPCRSLIESPKPRNYPCAAPKPAVLASSSVATSSCSVPAKPIVSNTNSAVSPEMPFKGPLLVPSQPEFGVEKPAPRPVPRPIVENPNLQGASVVMQQGGPGDDRINARVNGAAVIYQNGGEGDNRLRAQVNGSANITQVAGGGDDRISAQVNGPATIYQNGGEGNNRLSAVVNGPANITQVSGSGNDSLSAVVNGPAVVRQNSGAGDDSLKVTLGSGAARVQQNGGDGNDHHQVNFTTPNQGSTVNVNGGEGRNSATVSVGQAAVQVYNAQGELMFVSAGEGPSSIVTLENIQQTTYVGSQGQTIGQNALVNGRIINVQTGLPANFA